MKTYDEFIDKKTHLTGQFGFEPIFMPDKAFPFQRDIIQWATAKGRAAVFADCGLGKTMMQLAWCQNVVEKTNRPVLLLTPLAVGSQTVREAAFFGMEAKRSIDGSVASKITVTNYEKLHLFDPNDFVGVCCDESSILKHVKGATQKAVTRFVCKMPYRSLWTATAAPNDYTELGTSSEALGGLNHSEMLKMFFKQMDGKTTDQYEKKIAGLEKASNHFGKLSFRVSQAINGWRLKGHAHDHFWRWVCSWARACRKPSDLGFSDDGYILPPLIEREHIVTPHTPAEGVLFTMPAFGLKEERDERKRTINERCGLVAELVNHDRPAVIWVHANAEGDLLEKMIPNSVEVSGSHSDEYKESAADWFIGEKCICTDPLFRDKLATWKRKPTNNDIIERIAKNASLSQSSMGKPIPKNGKNTCRNTTQTTGISGNPPKNPFNSEEQRQELDTQPTQITGEKQSKLQKLIEKNIRQGEQMPHLKNTDQTLQLMSKQWISKDGSVQSVEAMEPEILEDIDSTLTTATQPENSGGCSVQIAILESESLETLAKLLKEHQCICGHLSGNRKLITKSKIFGLGQNWQHCNHVVTFATHSYEQYYQSVRRCWRFGQKNPVTVDIIASEGEVRVKENMDRKAAQADRMFSELVHHMNNALHETRSIKTITPTVPGWL